MSSPSGPKICVSAVTSNFSAASTNVSAACCGVLKSRAPVEEAVLAGETAFATDCCAAKKADADRPVHATAHRRQTRPDKLGFADLVLISGFLSFLFDCDRVCLPAPTTAAATGAPAATRSKAGGAATAAAPRARSAVSPGTSSEGIPVPATAAPRVIP